MIRALVVTLAAATPILAADREWTYDVRGNIGASSEMNDIDGESVDGKASLAWGVNAAAHRPLGDGDRLGLVLLAGFFRDVHRADEGDLDLDYTALGLNLGGGVSWKLNKEWHLEGVAQFRVGKGDLDGEDSNGTSISGDRGTTTAYGINAGAYYTFPFKLMVGGTVGYEFWKGESDISGSSFDVEGDGIIFGGVAGYAF